MIIMYGISNCDTIKKAKKFLTQNNLDFTFHDYKKLGINQDKLNQWCKQLGYENVINKRGTTWRKLPEEDKLAIDQNKAIELMQSQTSIIKRPILEMDDKLILGFDQSQYQTLL